MVDIAVSYREKDRARYNTTIHYRQPIGTHAKRVLTRIRHQEYETIRRLLERLNGFSYQRARKRLQGKLTSSASRRVDARARRTLKNLGRKMFNFVAGESESFEEMFGNEGTDLVWNIENAYRSFPWELMDDGAGPLSARYCVGRVVTDPPAKLDSGFPQSGRRALVVGINYTGETREMRRTAGVKELSPLKLSEYEAQTIYGKLDEAGFDTTLLKAKNATVEAVRDELPGVSIFHFSGHGGYREASQRQRERWKENSVICLADGDFCGGDMAKCFDNERGAPYLSFLNACQTAYEIREVGILDAFILYGGENVIGTYWSVFEEPAYKFARKFYTYALREEPFGNALRKTRQYWLRRRSLAASDTWPAYVLYGAPTARLTLP